MVISCYTDEKGMKCKGGRHWLDGLLSGTSPSEKAAGLVLPLCSTRLQKPTPVNVQSEPWGFLKQYLRHQLL